MSKKELIATCKPLIDEMVSIIKGMTAEQYEEFKRGHLEEVDRTCPKASGFIKDIFTVIEQELSQTA